mmetsp:Transcript_9331/g.25354  ORF Transcript_9331/g.25354 Transcript_9331/m.25354 type:complete len:379 (-) Transcript_9331:205-1341(-)
MRTEPNAAPAPSCSPITTDANAVPNNGSVEKMSVVSAAVSVRRACVSIRIVRPVVIKPVQMILRMMEGDVNHSAHGYDCSIATSVDHTAYPADARATAKSCAAVVRLAWPGNLFMALSTLQKPMPKARGWMKDSRSPRDSKGSPLCSCPPPSSSMPTPSTASIAPAHSRLLSFLPVANSMSGTVTTANEQMKADFDASVVSKPIACAMYPIEFQRPTSNPNHAAATVSCRETSSFGFGNSHGRPANDASPNRRVVLTPIGNESPSSLTSEKLVPYNAADASNSNRARQTSEGSLLVASPLDASACSSELPLFMPPELLSLCASPSYEYRDVSQLVPWSLLDEYASRCARSSSESRESNLMALFVSMSICIWHSPACAL